MVWREGGRRIEKVYPEKQKLPLEPAVLPVFGNCQVPLYFPVGVLSFWQTEEP